MRLRLPEVRLVPPRHRALRVQGGRDPRRADGLGRDRAGFLVRRVRLGQERRRADQKIRREAEERDPGEDHERELPREVEPDAQTAHARERGLNQLPQLLRGAVLKLLDLLRGGGAELARFLGVEKRDVLRHHRLHVLAARVVRAADRGPGDEAEPKEQREPEDARDADHEQHRAARRLRDVVERRRGIQKLAERDVDAREARAADRAEERADEEKGHVLGVVKSEELRERDHRRRRGGGCGRIRGGRLLGDGHRHVLEVG